MALGRDGLAGGSRSLGAFWKGGLRARGWPGMPGLRVRATAARASAGAACGLVGPPWWERASHLGVETGGNLVFAAVAFAGFVQVVLWHLGVFLLTFLLAVLSHIVFKLQSLIN